MLEVEGLVVGYFAPVAGPLTFRCPDGSCVMLKGSNGSGKSTLMKTLSGLVPPLSGTFRTNGEVVLVPTRINKVKGFTVREFVSTGMFPGNGFFRSLSHEDEARLQTALGMMELEALAGRDLSRISDGEFQKACIAASLTRKAGVLMLDEPTAFLDVENRMMVLGKLQEIARTEGTTVIFSTHDIHDGEIYSDITLDLGKGSV